ncbi:MAG: polysaccharide deacetylase family protein [Candidatus Acidiferrales bacterium]
MLKTAKKLTLLGARSLGVYSAFIKSSWRTERLLILGYHGFSQLDEHLWRPGLFMPPAMFVRRLESISRMGCNVLPLDEALTRLQMNSLPAMSVVLTFDDGFYNYYGVAHPVLKRFGFPSTVYQTSFYSGWNRPIFNLACSYLLWRAGGKVLDAQGITGEAGSFNTQTEQERKESTQKIILHARSAGISQDDRQKLVERLAIAAGASYQDISGKRLFNLMTRGELAAMVREGVDIQLHTHRHRVPEDEELFLKELRDNQKFLDEIGQPHATHFTYPSGVYRPDVFPWLEEYGVRSTTTCDTGLVDSHSNFQCLPRFIDTTDISQLEFEAWLCGLRSVLPGRSAHANGRSAR